MRRLSTLGRLLALPGIEGDEAGLTAGNWRAGPPLILLMPVLAALLLAGWAVLDLAGASNVGVAPRLEAAPSTSSELPLEADGEGAGKPAALARGSFAVAAVETSRRKLRAPQRPPAQLLTLVASFLPVALARSALTRRRRREGPLRPSRPPRPFLSQGPPSRNTS